MPKIILHQKNGYSIVVTGMVPFWTGVKIKGELHDPKGNFIEVSEIEIALDEVKSVLAMGQKIQSGEMKFEDLADTLIKAIFNALKGAFTVALIGKKK